MRMAKAVSKYAFVAAVLAGGISVALYTSVCGRRRPDGAKDAMAAYMRFQECMKAGRIEEAFMMCEPDLRESLELSEFAIMFGAFARVGLRSSLGLDRKRPRVRYSGRQELYPPNTLVVIRHGGIAAIPMIHIDGKWMVTHGITFQSEIP